MYINIIVYFVYKCHMKEGVRAYMYNSVLPLQNHLPKIYHSGTSNLTTHSKFLVTECALGIAVATS